MLKLTALVFLSLIFWGQAAIVKPLTSPVCKPPKSLQWTPWFDRDNIGGFGDYQTLTDLINEGKPICKVPLQVQCQTLSGIPAGLTADIVHYSPTVGCYCVNQEQTNSPKQCRYDYKVRFLCCQECPYGQFPYMTIFYDRDNPGGKGDYETLADLLAAGNPICKNPYDVLCVALDGTSIQATGQIVHYSPSVGCYCVNSEQPDGICNYDYKVSFGCCK